MPAAYRERYRPLSLSSRREGRGSCVHYAESNNFVEQEPTNLRNSETLTAVPTDTDTEFTPIPLHPEESKNPTCQPTKQGYLTSILSSLPNLSLSSITGDGSGTVQGAESVQNTKAPLHDRRDSLRDTSPPVIANFHDSRRANFTGFAEVNPGSGGSLQLPAPPQSTVPPTLPSTTNGPVSYRLGNQRRLKYAPPPDLTSKQYSSPVTQPLLAPHNPISTPNIFNPNESVGTIPSCQQPVEPSISTNSPSLQRSTPEYLSQANSLQESFRSSPVAISGVAYNSTANTSRSVTPQNQNSNLGVPATAQPIPHQVAEPATPQNTPANVNYFGYDTYGRGDFPPRAVENPERGGAPGKNRIEASLQIPKEEGTAKSVGVEAKPSVTFAPVSAVQVTEKLEHLLAEREEGKEEVQEEEDPSPCDETKIEDVTERRPVSNYDDAKLIGVEGTLNDLSRPDDLSRQCVFKKTGSTDNAFNDNNSPRGATTRKVQWNAPESWCINERANRATTILSAATFPPIERRLLCGSARSSGIIESDLHPCNRAPASHQYRSLEDRHATGELVLQQAGE
ncbi:SEC23-interacting protein isoform X1 [Apis mellifera carnica]|nr:SEC23-interacting protein isoform X1 [Apis mellifera carnica]